jgi:hypothetical protein
MNISSLFVCLRGSFYLSTCDGTEKVRLKGFPIIGENADKNDEFHPSKH